MPSYYFLISPIVSILIVLAGGLVVWGKMKKTICYNKKEIEEVKTELRAADGTTSFYLPRKEFSNSYQNCRDETGEQLQEIKTVIHEMDKKREQAREDQFKELQKITKFMGSVEEFMRTYDKSNGRKMKL